MAIRPVFVVNQNSEEFVEKIDVVFQWHPGFSLKQKQESIISLHHNFRDKSSTECKLLEVSSKSLESIGVKLSAFNLFILARDKRKICSVESAFQSSKVFEEGGPYIDLMSKSSREAKTDMRLKESGKLKYFFYNGREWGLEPTTHFYDWLYINALNQNEDLAIQVVKYNAFTDIEFNPEKSLNCQARSAALYVALHQRGLLDIALESQEAYMDVLGISKSVKKQDPVEQLSLF